MTMLKKEELVTRVAVEAGFTKKDTRVFIEAIKKVMGEALVEGRTVPLVNFGRFEVKDVPPHTYMVPGTDKKVEKGATKKVVFRLCNELKKAVKGGNISE